MKITKSIFALFITVVVLLTSACTGNNAGTSSDEPVSTEQSVSEDVSAEQSVGEIPESFDDGITSNYHVLGSSMYGDVMFEWKGEHTFLGKNSKINLLGEYFDKNSFIYKAYLEMGYKMEFLEDEKKGTSNVPLVDFENVYSAIYQFEIKKDSHPTFMPKGYTFEEVKAKGSPILLFLETAPLTESTVQDIQMQYGVDEEKAVAIYRRMVIDKLEEYGLYVEGFFDIYTYETWRALRIAQTDSWADVKAEQFEYEDNVYKTATHLFFSAYGKCADIEALEAALKSDENRLLKVRAMCGADYAYDVGKEAYTVEDASSIQGYYHRGANYFYDLYWLEPGIWSTY